MNYLSTTTALVKEYLVTKYSNDLIKCESRDKVVTKISEYIHNIIVVNLEDYNNVLEEELVENFDNILENASMLCSNSNSKFWDRMYEYYTNRAYSNPSSSVLNDYKHISKLY